MWEPNNQMVETRNDSAHHIRSVGLSTAMHFRVQMIVHLNQPLTIHGSDSPGCEGDSTVTGYLIVLGVNAPDMASAIGYAQETALNPKRGNGDVQTYDGYVEEAEALEIEESTLDADILENATRIDEPGVYYSTGLIFFDHKDEGRKWWEFWKERPTKACTVRS